MLFAALRAVLGFVLLFALLTAMWFWLHREALAYLVRSKDKKWTPKAAPETAPQNARERTIIFVRHVESKWNYVFNGPKNPLIFVPRLVKAALKEFQLLWTHAPDSWFLDAPASEHGLEQAARLRADLAAAIATKKDSHFAQVMLGHSGRSTVVSSPLRRAVTTCLVALWDRLSKSHERVVLLSDLIEISPNPDTLSLTPAHAQPQPSWVDRAYKAGGVDLAAGYRDLVDPGAHFGNKPVTSNGQLRLRRFCDWAFAEDRGVLIVFGHSLYFRSFFREFLPRSVSHVAKDKKLVNCGAVALKLQAFETPSEGTVFRIDPASIVAHHGGFSAK